MSECKYCRLFKERYKKREEDGAYILYEDKKHRFTISSEEPKCAFKGDEFSRDNWSCTTLSLMRRAYYLGNWGLHFRDDYIGTIFVFPIPEEVDEDGGFIILVLYKDRGAVDNAIRITSDKVETLKKDLAERMVDWLFEEGKVDWW